MPLSREFPMLPKRQLQWLDKEASLYEVKSQGSSVGTSNGRRSRGGTPRSSNGSGSFRGSNKSANGRQAERPQSAASFQSATLSGISAGASAISAGRQREQMMLINNLVDGPSDNLVTPRGD